MDWLIEEKKRVTYSLKNNHMIIVIKFLKDQWLGSLLSMVFLIYILSGQFSEPYLRVKQNNIESKISALNKSKVIEYKKIDSLSHIDTVFVTRIKLIKQKSDEKIKVVDGLNISELQQYFSNRYPE